MTPRPNRPEDSSRDDDPTGMRELLSSLPDPGPMPEDLAERIRLRIEAEVSGGAIDLDAERRRRRPSARQLVGAAAAFVIVAVGGMALMQAAGVDVRTVVAGSSNDSVASSAESATAQEEPGSGTQAPRVGGDFADVPVVLVLTTGRDYDSSDLARGAAALVADLPTNTSSDAPPDMLSDSSDAGPLGEPATARACADAVGIPRDVTLVVDVATVDGRPAAVLLAGDPHGGHTAYAVGRSCSADDPQMIAGPVAVG